MATVTKVMTKSGERHKADFYDENGRRVRAFFRSKHEASAFLHRRAQEVEHFRRYGERVRRGTNPLFRDFVDRYLRSAPAHLKQTSLERARECTKHLLDHFDGKRLPQITEEDALGYRIKRQQRVKRSTVTRELIVLKAILRFALEVHELVSVPKIKLDDPRKSLAPPRCLSADEYACLIATADPELKTLIKVALSTGLRRAELYRLTWGDVTLEGRLLFVRGETKSGWPRTIPLSSLAYDTLASMAAAAKTSYVFHWWRALAGVKSVRKRLESALRRAGVFKFRPFQDLRHTFGSWAAMQGVDLQTLANWMGHRSMDLVKRYSHPTTAHEQQMIERVMAFTGQQAGNRARKAGQA